MKTAATSWITLLCFTVTLGCAEPAAPPAPAPPPGAPSALPLPVVGGTVDSQTKGVMGLGVSLSFFMFFGHCTGTLIAPNLILTARHCVALTQSPAGQGSVVCGQTPFTLQGAGEMFRATSATVRPGFDGPAFYKGVGQVFVDENANDICGYDVALIMLAGKGVPASVATPIPPRLDQYPQPGESFSAVGYGLTQPNGKESGTRMRIDGRKVLCFKTNCTAMVKPTEFGSDAPTCQGDSGGPAIDAQGRVFGVLSRGPQGCTSSVYGDTASNRALIVRAAKAAAKSGGYPLPDWAQPYAAGDAGPEAGPDQGAPDQGLTPDQGPTTPDAAGADLAEAVPTDDGGCALSRGPSPTSPATPWLLALLLLARRRRRG